MEIASAKSPVGSHGGAYGTAEIASAKSPATGEIEVWRFGAGEITPLEGADRARAVGSLQKAWVLKAWAEAHPDASVPLPRSVCEGGSSCWLHRGHGSLGLRRATSLSCNAYFRRLANETPEWLRRKALEEVGFQVPERLDADASIGLLSGEAVTITPRALMNAFASLVSAPWTAREDGRRELLDGLRDAAEAGTAGGLPMRGLLAKTGTVPAEDAPLAVSGWAMAFDPGGTSGRLLFLPRGSGAEAAVRLGELYARELPGAAHKTPARVGSARPRRAIPDVVRVRLLSSLGGAVVTARNVGTTPASGARGWIGPGAEVRLEIGDRVGEATWELQVAPYGLLRRVRGSLELHGGTRQRLVLTTSQRDYVEGVVRGELSPGSPHAEELAATILRFLAFGARHGTEDVCDLSHCAHFVGLGPLATWTRSDSAVMTPSPLPPPALNDVAYQKVRRAAAREGPRFFSTHCGGESLSEREVWGIGSDASYVCRRHAGDPSPWTRFLPEGKLRRALGNVSAIEVVDRNGVRVTRVTLAGGGARTFLYDELHSALADSMGWDALPSPPDAYEREEKGWRVSGRGRGHRVGLCLSD